MQTLKNLFHLLEAFVANSYYGFPSQKIKVIGVTGTDGKTTTTHAIYHLLKESGKKVSMVSSVYANIGGDISDTGFHTTTPRAFTVFGFLKKAVDARSEYFVLETTSHALAQNRVWGIGYEVGVLTNVTQEHSMEHKTFDDYMRIKTLLLLRSTYPIINRDAAAYEDVKKILKAHSKQFSSYSLARTDAEYTWDSKIKTDISESFNKENILAAYACCLKLGLEREKLLQTISSFTLPQGRMDIVHHKDFMVIIDFAHTPNAIHHVLQEIRKNYLKKGGRIIHVFGCASERDNVKRPMMGKASAQFADYILLTEEDYRNEDVTKISKEIASGIGSKPYEIEPDREKAIERAIKMTQKNDIVVCTGKSHEKSLARNGKEYPWDEYGAVERAVESR